MKKIMFGNSLMLLGIAIMILAGLELIYIGIMWASFLLKWRYGLTKFPIGTSRPQTNVSASLHLLLTFRIQIVP